MLQLKNIYKTYTTGDFKQTALNGIRLNFRENEFVAVLGASGSGKTTLLNIIGGLDQYDKGDLIINGVSTKKYKDRDWDTYRNHSIGFVFQSYNLIPHQSILSNVELALTLSGTSKQERRQRATEALEKVGLAEHMHKRPNQMSGGQMQRVAIARALVNNPDILLADEPTGALDSETSVQIMELLKEIAKDKLIIMVTHNPELSTTYANRIIKLFDGNVTDDSNPYEVTDDSVTTTSTKKMTKPSMSFFTALSLSFNNLLTKKGRTIMTAFAGSIGIIGIAAILALSNGVNNYIMKTQEDALSSYPITIESSAIDISSMMGSFMGTNSNSDEEKALDRVYVNNMMNEMISSMTAQISSNDLERFKSFIDSDESNINQYTQAIQYGYALDLKIYKTDTSNGIKQVNPSTLFQDLGLATDSSSSASSMMTITGTNVFDEMLSNETLLQSQYDVIAGSWPTNYDEIVLIVDENNEISDMVLYSLGLKDTTELEEMIKKLMLGEEVDTTSSIEDISYSYEDILNMTFSLVLNTDIYEEMDGVWVNKSSNEAYMKQAIKNGLELKIVGILRPNEDTLSSSISTTLAYSSQLTEYVINEINQSDIVLQQQENQEIDVFTNKPFETDENQETFDINALSPEEQAYIASLSEDELNALMAMYQTTSTSTYEGNLRTLGVVDLANPSKINIYPKDFDSKEQIEDIISDYNQKMIDEGKEEYKITYTDYIGLILSSVTSIINIITYVLIAFVSISLIVSSIMIAIITYISVLERTKEIGILRSIGASKKDVSRIFNAETLIIGLTSGLFGVGITYLLTFPINAVIKSITGASNIAKLPLNGAIILVIISILLSVIAGLIPARSASKKDPVEALRTE